MLYGILCLPDNIIPVTDNVLPVIYEFAIMACPCESYSKNDTRRISVTLTWSKRTLFYM